jgi:hypothetical protein
MKRSGNPNIQNIDDHCKRQMELALHFHEGSDKMKTISESAAQVKELDPPYPKCWWIHDPVLRDTTI